MELDLRHLRMVVMVADQGSITKAAAALGISQPSLTAQLQRIERALGSPLLERSRQGTTLTPMGRNLVARARTILAEMADLPGSLGFTEPELDTVRLRLGAPPGGLLAALVPAITSRYEEHAGAERAQLVIDVHTEHVDAALIKQLAAGMLDATIVYEHIDRPRPGGLGVQFAAVTPFEPALVCLSQQHPLARREIIELTELADEPWVADPEDDLGGIAHIRQVCRRAGFEPKITHRLTDSFVAMDFVANGHGVALVQGSAAEPRGTVLRRLAGDPFGHRIDLAWTDRCPVPPSVLTEAARAAYLQLVDKNPAFSSWWRDHHGAAPITGPGENRTTG